MDTDYAAPVEVDRIRARVLKVVETERGPEERQTWIREFPVSAEVDVTPGAYALPATFGVLPNDGDIDLEIVIELEALESASDRVLVSRRVRTGFVPSETRLIRMHLYRACETLSCPDGETCGCADPASCSAPSCIDETVPPEDLETIDDPGALPADAGIPILDGGAPDASVPDGGIINCEPPLSICGLDCVNIQADPRYCGDCDSACSDGQVCEAGSCINPGDCRTNDIGCSGFSYCNEDTGECLAGCVANAQCTGENQICDVELHECVCDTGFESCPFGCVDTDIDPRFCGDCENVCPTGNVCEVGVCIDPGDCRTNGIVCSGFTYCDPASGDCLPGCAIDVQCTGQNETCDTVTHECVCADDFERCDQACFPTSCPPGQVLYQQTCAETHVQTANTQGDAGEFTTIALDAAGSAAIACYVSSGKDLRYLSQQPDGSWVSEKPDGPDDVGEYASIAFDPAGVAHIAYYNASSGSLMFATEQGAGGWGVEVADPGDDEKVGQHASLAFDAAGTAHVSYYDATNKDLMYAKRPSGGAWSVERVDTNDDVGKYTSLVVRPDGTVHLSYYNATDKDLKYGVRQVNGSWTLRTVSIGSDDVGEYGSLAFDAAGVAHISFYDATNKDFLLASRLPLGFWLTTAIESAGDVGKYGSLAFGPDGAARVSYYDESEGDLKFAIQEPDQSWAIRTVDSAGDVGRYTSLAVDAFGNAHISYQDRTNKSTKYALIAAPE